MDYQAPHLGKDPHHRIIKTSLLIGLGWTSYHLYLLLLDLDLCISLCVIGSSACVIGSSQFECSTCFPPLCSSCSWAFPLQFVKDLHLGFHPTTIGLTEWGSPGLRGPRASGLLDMGQTNGLWRYKTEDSTRVRMGLSLTWKASLASEYEDSFLCNRPYVTLDPFGVYINRSARSIDRFLIIIVRQARLLWFSHYDLWVDQLL